ncbi:MAG: uracil-DNA glycosylase [Desulfobacteraceae bacterium]
MKTPADPYDTIEAVKTTLRQMADWGCRGFDPDPETFQILQRWAAPQTPVEVPPETLEDIRGHLGDCQRCRLAKGRTHIVFGQGDPKARLVFVGEGPGADEDRQGLAFVGAAGQLLTKIIEAMDLTRETVYICNVIKCRPPGNRNPEPDEIQACRPFLERQLTAIGPEVICTLGTFAAQTLLDTTTPISRLRGRFHDYNGIKLMPTYHPAYLLRNPEQKRAVWEDVQKIMVLLNLNKS